MTNHRELYSEILIDSAGDNSDHTLSMIQQPQQIIDVFTQDMDSGIYNRQQIEQALSNFIRQHRNARVRVLVQDSSNAARHGHCLILLSQSLSSYVSIHAPSKDYENEKCSFMIVDRIGIIIRKNDTAAQNRVLVNYHFPLEATKLGNYFNEMWEHSLPDNNSRHLYI